MDEKDKIKAELEREFSRQNRYDILKAQELMNVETSDEFVENLVEELEEDIAEEKHKSIQERRKKYSKKREFKYKKLVLNILFYLALAGVWVFTAYTAIDYFNTKMLEDREYLQEEFEAVIAQMQAENSAEIEALLEKITSMNEEISVIIDAIAEADDSITSSSQETQEVLQDRIDELDAVIDELQASLKILQEKSGS